MRVALVVLGVVLGLGVVEGALRILDRRQPAVEPRAPTSAPPVVEYPSAAQYLAEAQRYFAAHEPVGGGLVQHHRPHLDEVFQGVRVRTNGDGWRNAEVSSDKAGRFRIVVVGDSVTFGWGVEEEQTYPRRLERLLAADASLARTFEVVNLGNGGYNTAQEHAALLRDGFGYDPDLVVLLYVTNDFHTTDGRDELSGTLDAPDGVAGRALQRLLPAWRRVVERSALLTRLVYAWRSEEPQLHEKIVRRYGSVERYWDEHPGWIRSRDALRGIARDCAARGIPFVVVFYSFTEDFYTVHLLPRVARVGDEEGFAVVDLRTRARLTLPLERYVNSSADVHPNADGHRVVAEVVYEVVRDLVRNDATTAMSSSGSTGTR